MGSQPANALSALQDVGTVLIADTADFQRKCSAKFSREMLTSTQVIEKFKPSEGTTNPSLLYSAAQNPAYSSLLARTIKYAKSLEPPTPSQDRLQLAAEYLAVQFGTEIYKLTGRVSTEVDVIHSFNTDATTTAALRVISLYAAQGVPKEKVRIKISATWEGIKAASILTKEHGISVLITIVFGMVQAIPLLRQALRALLLM